MVNTNKIDVLIAAMTAFLAVSLIAAPALVTTENLEGELTQPPAGLLNWTALLRGYPAYLDNDVSSFLVSGSSMFPALRDNDLIWYVETSVQNVDVGDIIIFYQTTRPGSPLVAHRVYEKTQTGVLTQGDAADLPDQLNVTDNELVGLVIGALYNSSQAWGLPT